MSTTFRAGSPSPVPSGDQACGLCDKEDESNAISRCKDCNTVMCDLHTQMHHRSKSTKHHKVVILPLPSSSLSIPLASFPLGPPSPRPKTPIDVAKCSVHVLEELRLYCESPSCLRLICGECAATTHRDHAHGMVDLLAANHRSEVLLWLSQAQGVADLMQRDLDMLGCAKSKVAKDAQQARSRVKEHTAWLRDELVKRETLLASEVASAEASLTSQLQEKADQLAEVLQDTSFLIEQAQHTLSNTSNAQLLAADKQMIKLLSQQLKDVARTSWDDGSSICGILFQSLKTLPPTPTNSTPSTPRASGVFDVQAWSSTSNLTSSPSVVVVPQPIGLSSPNSAFTAVPPISTRVPTFQLTFESMSFFPPPPPSAALPSPPAKRNLAFVPQNSSPLTSFSSTTSFAQSVVENPAASEATSQQQLVFPEWDNISTITFKSIKPDEIEPTMLWLGRVVVSSGPATPIPSVTKGSPSNSFQSIASTPKSVSFSSVQPAPLRTYTSIRLPVKQFGSRGKEQGQFNTPHYVAVASSVILRSEAWPETTGDENLWMNSLVVSDDSNHRLQVLDKNTGKPRLVIGTGHGNARGQLNCPLGVALLMSRASPRMMVVVADMSNHRVQVFDIKTGEYVYQITDPDHMKGPHGVAVIPQTGQIVVANGYSHCVTVHQGEACWSSRISATRRGRNSQQILSPLVNVDFSDEVSSPFPSPSALNGIPIDKSLGRQRAGSNPFKIEPDQGVAPNANTTANNNTSNSKSPAKIVAVIGTPHRSGSQDGQFDGPCGVAVNSKGHLIVADWHNSRIQVFDSPERGCTFFRKFGTRGSDNSQFKNPWGVAIDHFDNILVGDWNNHRVQVFSEDGTFLHSWKIGDAGKPKNPAGVGVDFDSGLVYVVDSASHRIQAY